MLSPKRAAPLLCIAAFILTLLSLRAQESGWKRWRDGPPIPGDGDLIPEEKAIILTSSLRAPLQPDPASQPIFTPGIPKPHGSNYTRALIMPRMSTEDISWIVSEALSVMPAIYTVDDPSSPLRAPANKGHEVMVYLSYIIDHYDALADINIFMHAHRWSWHNNELLNHDAAEMIRRLSSEHVVRHGFVNLRCHWNPGCPDWVHPGVVADDANKREEARIVQAWAELFPGRPVPATLAQPCCAQFAATRERIRAVARARWVFYREWLLRTELSDFLSGRIWEYLWQVAFTGEAYVCRDQHECYCDGYGICFEDGQAFDAWLEMRALRVEAQTQLDSYLARVQAYADFTISGTLIGLGEVEEPEPGKDEALRARVEELDRELEEKRNAAVARGADARIRAQIVGRPWSDGDGF